HFTDLRDLSSCEDLHRRLSITLSFVLPFVPGSEVPPCDATVRLPSLPCGVPSPAGSKPVWGLVSNWVWTACCKIVAEAQFLLIRALEILRQLRPKLLGGALPQVTGCLKPAACGPRHCNWRCSAKHHAESPADS